MNKKQGDSVRESANTSTNKVDKHDNDSSSSALDPRQSAVFVIKQQYKQLTNETYAKNICATMEDNKKSKSLRIGRISFAELVHCACFPFTKKSQELMHVIKRDASLYTQYECILEKMSFAVSGEQVAASSTSQTMSRTTDSFDFQIKPDNSNSQQVHLLLNLKPAQENGSAYAKGIFLHCVLRHEFKVLHFANILDGQAQIIIDKESAIYHLITSPNTRFYLC